MEDTICDHTITKSKDKPEHLFKNRDAASTRNRK
jgi:hypothetical protein